MRIPNRKLLMIVADGIDQLECDQLRMGFEDEGARILAATPGEYISVETVVGNRQGKDILIDLPFETIVLERFDGLIIPDGLLSSAAFSEDDAIIDLVQRFHEHGLPIFASGRAVEVLYRSRVLSQCVLVREGEPISSFVDQAVRVLLDTSERYAVPQLPIKRFYS